MSVIQAGAATIVPRIIGMPAAGMEHGINRIITMPADVPVIPAGAAAIVPNAVDMEHGINRIITVPAGVPVISAGAVAIVPRIKMPFIVTVMEHGADPVANANPVGAEQTVPLKIRVMTDRAGEIALGSPQAAIDNLFPHTGRTIPVKPGRPQ